ncbi:glycerophosphodiester phosphodiesterase family protein [Thioclava sp. 15-R06ZXC-3]|uniref:Glycerophosphodiester phosphodiesterase family protein n=1 Tax=Thioclava arctica TaxID=3238301 RepID=A0ABV3TJG5_9RHOB
MALHPAFLNLPIAHRALHDTAAGRPENSLAAMRAAIAAGYGIELDLQSSADGEVMVFHDYSLHRLTEETGPVKGRTAAELSNIALRGGDEGIPTLAEVIALVDGRAPLLIEIKDQDGAMGPNVGQLEAAAAELLRDYPGPLAVMSFNPHSIAAFSNAAPAICVGLTTSAYDAQDWQLLPAARRDALRSIPDFDAVGAQFISHEAKDLDSPRVADLKARNVPVLCWTIRSLEAELQARRMANNVTFEGYLSPLSA